MISPAETRILKRMWKSGALLQDIGKRLGISSAAVSNRAGRLGLAPRKERTSQHAPLSPKVEKAIIASYRKGLTLKKLTKKHGITKARLFSILRRHREPARLRPFDAEDRYAKAAQLEPQIRRLRKMGRSYQSIVDEFGLPITTVRNIAIEAGVGDRISTRIRQNMVKRLRQAMDHDGRTDMEMAKAIGYKRASTELFIYGTAIVKWAKKLAKQLKCSPNWILEGTDKPKYLR